MSTLTTNLGLVKPSGNERPQVSVINANMDALDAVIGDPSNLRSGSDITSDIKTLRDSVYLTSGTYDLSGMMFPAYITASGNYVTFCIDKKQISISSVAISFGSTDNSVMIYKADGYLTKSSIDTSYSHLEIFANAVKVELKFNSTQTANRMANILFGTASITFS